MRITRIASLTRFSPRERADMQDDGTYEATYSWVDAASDGIGLVTKNAVSRLTSLRFEMKYTFAYLGVSWFTVPQPFSDCG